MRGKEREKDKAGGPQQSVGTSVCQKQQVASRQTSHRADVFLSGPYDALTCAVNAAKLLRLLLRIIQLNLLNYQWSRNDFGASVWLRAHVHAAR